MPVTTTSLSTDWIDDPLAAPSTARLEDDPLAKDPLAGPKTEMETGGTKETGIDPPPVDEVNLARAGDVLSRSNSRKDPVWKKFNDEADELTLPEKEQPEAWRLGIQVKGVDTTGDGVYDEYTVTGGEDVGIEDIEDYRKMLKKDFNFSGTISRYIGLADGNAKAGGKLFVDAVLVRYELDGDDADPAQKAKVEGLAKNIWSYASTGMDIKGNTDVAQMQGMLFALDSELVKVSNSNTEMQDTEFTLPGTDETLKDGDGLHGRATILTTRHLMDNVSDDPGDNELTGYDHTILLADISGSMEDDRKNFGRLMDAGNVTGDVSIATFYDDDRSLNFNEMTRSPELTEIQEEKKALMAERRKLMDDASGDHTVRLKEISAEVGALNKRQRVLEKTPEKMTPGRAGDSLKRNRDPIYSGVDGVQDEEGMRNAIKVLSTYPVPEEPPTKPYTSQLIILTDEGDKDASALPELQLLADSLGFDVKVMFSKNGEVAIIDLMELTPKIYKAYQTNTLDWSRAVKDGDFREWSDYTD
ncbi:MAG: hypothetical protein ACI8RZ_007299 [Myxococcota bacterium]|jgi:hypothetical protein